MKPSRISFSLVCALDKVDIHRRTKIENYNKKNIDGPEESRKKIFFLVDSPLRHLAPLLQAQWSEGHKKLERSKYYFFLQWTTSYPFPLIVDCPLNKTFFTASLREDVPKICPESGQMVHNKFFPLPAVPTINFVDNHNIWQLFFL